MAPLRACEVISVVDCPSGIVGEEGTPGSTNSTTISATFSDARTLINQNSIILKIDGNDVTTSATINSTSINYPASGLANGALAVDLTVMDTAGNTAVELWVFNVNATS